MEENNLQKLDAIKEIIFGENIKEYDKEFKKIRDSLVKQKDEIQSLIKEMRKEMQDLIKDADKDLKKQIDEFKKESIQKISQLEGSKMDKDAVADMFIDLGKAIKNK